MFRNLIRTAMILVLAVAWATPESALAQGKGHGKGKGHDSGKGQGKAQGQGDGQGVGNRGGGNPHGAQRAVVVPVFGDRDRQVILDYYGTRTSGLPPGLAKRGGNLPPGLQKQLERNGTLPPGLQKRLQPLPGDLARRLPPLPPVYRRGVIGEDVVVYNRTTGIIVDIIHGVLRATGR